MPDFSVTSLFVVPTSNTLPTSGTNADLTSGQFGIFRPDYTPATVANVGNAKYIFLSQGRNVYTPFEITKNSAEIYADKVVSWYKVVGNLQQNTQVTSISDLTVGCNEDVSITLRLDSFYIRAAYANGLTRSVMTTTPCCDCGSNPCDSLTGSQIQQVMSQLAQNINDDEILSPFVTAGTQGSGANTVIIIQGNTPDVYGQGTSPDLTNFPYQMDRLYFWTFVRTGPDLTTDFEVQDACSPVATVQILQRAAYPINTPAEIRQLELDFWSYQAQYKSIFSNVNYNGEFQSYVDSTSAYDLYYIEYKSPQQTSWSIGETLNATRTSIIAIPKGSGSEAGTLAILTAFLGTPDNDSSTPTSTTSFTTSSTTTTTTTLLPTP